MPSLEALPNAAVGSSKSLVLQVGATVNHGVLSAPRGCLRFVKGATLMLSHMADAVRFLHLFHAPLELPPPLIVFFLIWVLAARRWDQARWWEASWPQWRSSFLSAVEFKTDMSGKSTGYNSTAPSSLIRCYTTRALRIIFFCLCLLYAHCAKVHTRKYFIQHM